MTREELLERLLELAGDYDPEEAHIEADTALLEFSKLLKGSATRRFTTRMVTDLYRHTTTKAKEA